MGQHIDGAGLWVMWDVGSGERGRKFENLGD